MTSDRSLITLSELVRHASAIVDVDGADEAVTAFALRYEDDDVPVRGVLDGLEERIAWGADEDPPVVMAQALVLYLAHRLDEVDEDPDELLLLAARSEFDGAPPERDRALAREQPELVRELCPHVVELLRADRRAERLQDRARRLP